MTNKGVMKKNFRPFNDVNVETSDSLRFKSMKEIINNKYFDKKQTIK